MDKRRKQQNVRAMRKRRYDAGLCRECGKEPRRKGRVLGEECEAKRAATYRAVLAAGLCGRCREPRKNLALSLCGKCRAGWQEWRAA